MIPIEIWLFKSQNPLVHFFRKNSSINFFPWKSKIFWNIYKKSSHFVLVFPVNDTHWNLTLSQKAFEIWGPMRGVKKNCTWWHRQANRQTSKRTWQLYDPIGQMSRFCEILGDMWHVTYAVGWISYQNFSSVNYSVTKLFVEQPRLHRVC